MVVAFRIFLSKILCEYVVTGTCQSIRTHTAVVLLLVCCLSERSQSYDNVTRTYVGIVDNVLALHTASYGRVDNDGAYEVANVGCLAACSIYAYSHFAQFGKQLVGAIDDGRDNLARDEHLVTSDSA